MSEVKTVISTAGAKHTKMQQNRTGIGMANAASKTRTLSHAPVEKIKAKGADAKGAKSIHLKDRSAV
jgi:plasmid maintenance system killer protein